MCDAEGIWQEDDRQVETIVVDYFSNIFKSNGIIDASAVVEVVQPIVTESMNRGLVQEFQVVEVVKALKQMHPKTSPCPNGMPPLFYQHYWSLVGNCVTQTVHDFPNLNETPVVLIPKIKKPTKITQYRPISLSNVVSRMTAKVLAPRPHYPFIGFAPRDPLSPYLFLICVKGLSTLLKKTVDDSLLKGLAACQRGPKISYLFFAEDSLIFC